VPLIVFPGVVHRDLGICELVGSRISLVELEPSHELRILGMVDNIMQITTGWEVDMLHILIMDRKAHNGWRMAMKCKSKDPPKTLIS